jgi:DNA-binding HxlR family transcriptional regulator
LALNSSDEAIDAASSVRRSVDFAMSAESNSRCPVCRTADVVCGKWTLLVIRDLADGCSRFCELERSLEGISPRTLSLRLRALEEEGIVARRTFPEVPPRVEYALTEKGEALVPLIEDMRRYGMRWLLEEEAAEPVPA